MTVSWLEKYSFLTAAWMAASVTPWEGTGSRIIQRRMKPSESVCAVGEETGESEGAGPRGAAGAPPPPPPPPRRPPPPPPGAPARVKEVASVAVRRPRAIVERSVGFMNDLCGKEK